MYSYVKILVVKSYETSLEEVQISAFKFDKKRIISAMEQRLQFLR